MSEDWAAVAAEVTAAIRSVSDVSQPGGYPVTLRIPGTFTGPEYDPTGTTPPTYKTLYCVEGFQEIRDQSGTLIGQTKHTLTVTADPDAVPLKDHKVAIGITAEQASESSAWVDIVEVRPVKPAQIAVMYELDIQT
jgi:hypothetical protein